MFHFSIRQKIQSRTVSDLKEILVHLNLKKSGRKAELVDRIVGRIRENGQLLDKIENYLNTGVFSSTSNNRRRGNQSQSHSLSQNHNNYHSQQNSYGNSKRNSNEVERQRAELAKKYLDRLTKGDPFSERKRVVLPVKIFKMPNIHCRFNLSTSDYNFLSQNPESKVRLYSLELNNEVNPNDLSHNWPTQSQLLVNGIFVQLIQKCVDGQHKSKSLKERPADITVYVHEGINTFRLQGKPNHQLGDWNFGLAIIIEIPRPVSALITEMKIKNLISADITRKSIKKMFSGDDDIVTAQMSVSVKCPLSLKRLSIPARGKDCTHLSCFDLESFLNFQKDAKNASWKCIVCNGGPLNVDTIVVDEWMNNILQDIKNTENVDHVEVFEDGTYKVILEGKSGLADSDDDSLPPKKRKIRQRAPVVANDITNDYNNNAVFDPFMLFAGNDTGNDYNWNVNPYNPTSFSQPLNNLAEASNNSYQNLNMNMNLGSNEENAIEL